MRYPSLEEFLNKSGTLLAKGPVGLIFVEDDVEVESTIRHHLSYKFKQLLVFIPHSYALPAEIEELVHRIDYDIALGQRYYTAINAILGAAPRNVWFYYCFNAEYLFFPFCETRSVGELLTFHSEERRRSMITFVVDAYADDLTQNPNAVSLETAHIDRSGYYSLARWDDKASENKERQLDFYGGVRWRYEEHIPYAQQRIDRVGLFRSEDGLRINTNHTFNIEEYNTYSCPWHHNLSAAIVSFRTVKALKTNPGSAHAINTFMWHASTPFDWSSAQLMDFGLMEPGQWF